jgi:hypothetical protein
MGISSSADYYMIKCQDLHSGSDAGSYYMDETGSWGENAAENCESLGTCACKECPAGYECNAGTSTYDASTIYDSKTRCMPHLDLDDDGFGNSVYKNYYCPAG